MDEREVLHFAVGPEACELTSHLFNLQGLAATSGSCVSGVTHTTHNTIIVPRALLVDCRAGGSAHYSVSPEQFDVEVASSNVWDQKVERIDLGNQRPSDDAFNRILQQSTLLSNSTYSRYRSGDGHNQTTSYRSSGRQVVWDDELKDDGNDADDDSDAQKAIDEKRKVTWLKSTCHPIQHELNAYWTMEPKPDLKEVEATHSIPEPDVRVTSSLEKRHWRDYWMLSPQHPRSCLHVPSTFQSTAGWDSFCHGRSEIPVEWREDELFDQMRRMLEGCDSCQGVVMSTSSLGWSAGLTSLLLEELHDECPSVYKSLITLESDQTTAPGDENSWHSRNVDRVRRQVEQGLSLHQYKEMTQTILPLQVSEGTSFPVLAAAIENATLPYRMRREANGLIGLNSAQFYGTMSGHLSFGSARNLSFREFTKQVLPFPALNILGLDVLEPGALRTDTLDTMLREGTSVERDRRQRDRNASLRGSSDLPGMWMQQVGVVKSLSPIADIKSTDYSLHSNFALFPALRTTKSQTMATTDYLTCLMEGMGPRFRPGQTSGVVLRESLVEELVSDGYGAGSYWKAVWQKDQIEPSPVLSVLSNTTRSHSHLDRTGVEMQEGLSSKLRGFYNRDQVQGILPELDDCREALLTVWDLRDAYLPPSGSGLR